MKGANMEKKTESHQHHHYILPTSTACAVGGALLVLTFITVWVAGIDLGKINFLVAMIVATIKASLVGMWFMNLRKDRRENAVIFLTSFLFLAIFIALTVTDLFYRGDVYVKEPWVASVQSKSRFKKPWVSTPELVSYGKTQFNIQCAMCHGAGGKGDGPAGVALKPSPRNFTQADGWKAGRKPTRVFKTLTEGLGGMPAFGSLPSDDRWALAQYVLSLGPVADQDAAADFAAIKVDPNKESAGEEAVTSIPVDVAIERMAVPEEKTN